MHTMSGTRPWCASTTAGWSSAAAVPLVTQMTVGLPVAIARPRAKNAALRSSRRTCVRRRSAKRCCQRGRPRTGTDHRIGDPEPGPLIHQGGAERGLYAHPSCHSMSKCAARGRRWWCCMDSPRPVGSGVASDEHLAEAHTLVAVDLPGHGGSDSVRADLPTAAALVAEAVRAIVGNEPCGLLGYSLGARVALHVVTGTDLALRPCGLHRRDRRHRGPGSACTSPPRG